MLKGISPLFSPELLAAIYRMGHGDEIVLADAHFPGHSLGVPVIRAECILHRNDRGYAQVRECDPQERGDTGMISRLVDSHVHFWNPEVLHYEWLASLPSLNHPFLPADLARESSNVPVEKIVFVQAD